MAACRRVGALELLDPPSSLHLGCGWSDALDRDDAVENLTATGAATHATLVERIVVEAAEVVLHLASRRKRQKSRSCARSNSGG